MDIKENKELVLGLYKKMLLCRKFEENVQYYFSLGMIHGTTHLSIGEEGTAAGTCSALEETDQIFVTHRGHSDVICKGIDINKMMAEIFAKETGICHGKGGSMHIADLEKGIMGANGIVGGGIPLSLGNAFANKHFKNNKVTVCFFGDGATNEGAFHESMNLASVWNLPIIFVCVNNTYGMSTHISKVMKITDIEKRGEAYGIPSVSVDGNDCLKVYETVKKAREYVASGKGPILVVENTYRISGHSKSDGNLYRTKDEINEWKERCPIRFLKSKIIESKVATKEDLKLLDDEASQIIDDAVEFALKSPLPNVADIYNGLYSE